MFRGDDFDCGSLHSGLRLDLFALILDANNTHSSPETGPGSL